MKVIVEFDSLLEFEQFRGSGIEAKDYTPTLEQLQRQIATQGENIALLAEASQQREMHKDFKEADDLLENGEPLNQSLYNEVVTVLARLESIDDNFGDNRVKQVLRKITGDYDLKPIYNDDMLHRIKWEAEKVIQRIE